MSNNVTRESEDKNLLVFEDWAKSDSIESKSRRHSIASDKPTGCVPDVCAQCISENINSELTTLVETQLTNMFAKLMKPINDLKAVIGNEIRSRRVLERKLNDAIFCETNIKYTAK